MRAHAGLQATPLNLLERRLDGLYPLADADLRPLRVLSSARQIHRAGTEIERAGTLVGAPLAVTAGWACRMRLLPDGRQQIISIVLPGDLAGLCSRPSPLSLASLCALTEVETIDATAVAVLFRSAPPDCAALCSALAIGAAVEDAYALNQVVRLGRQTAPERVAGLLLELRDRLAAVGLGGPSRFPMPLTQEALANTLGLSAVHLNRTLQQLRRERLIVLRAGEVELLDVAQLTALADYEAPRVSAVQAVR